MPAAPCEPMPPVADTAMPWDAPVADPVAALRSARRELGDTFAVVSGGTTYVFVFSPGGVRSFYDLPEERASKGVADWQLLTRKLPPEIFDGRRTLPHELFDRDHVASYMTQLDWAIDRQVDDLGAEGVIDAFALTRRLGHLLGLASWGAADMLEPGEMDDLVAALDQLDGADAFVHPGDMHDVAQRDMDIERHALRSIEHLMAEVLSRLDGPRNDLFGEIVDRWSGTPDRVSGIARDVTLVHVASMSNMHAALGWTIVDVVRRPELVDRIRGGDASLTERCALESTRLAQRSIMLRAVLRPVELADEDTVYRLAPGAVAATLLPLMNTSAEPGLDRFDPDRWTRRRIPGLSCPERVTAFGHGKHTCPAQPFALAAMVRSVTRLVTTYELSPLFSDPQPVTGQIGGVARSARPCPVRYVRRGGDAQASSGA